MRLRETKFVDQCSLSFLNYYNVLRIVYVWGLLTSVLPFTMISLPKSFDVWLRLANKIGLICW